MLGIIFCILLMWLIGYFIALMVTGGAPRTKLGTFLQALLGLVIGLAFLGCIYLSEENDAREYNNGICSECGSEYRFSGAAGRSINKHYYYSCAECDHTIQVESIQN